MLQKSLILDFSVNFILCDSKVDMGHVIIELDTGVWVHNYTNLLLPPRRNGCPDMPIVGPFDVFFYCQGS